MCTAVSQHAVLYPHDNHGPFNTALLLTFPYTLHGTLLPAEQRGGPEQPVYAVIWDRDSTRQPHNWFIDHLQFIVL